MADLELRMINILDSREDMDLADDLHLRLANWFSSFESLVSIVVNRHFGVINLDLGDKLDTGTRVKAKALTVVVDRT